MKRRLQLNMSNFRVSAESSQNTAVPIEGDNIEVQKKMRNSNKLCDEYCWQCHKSVSNAKLSCTKCPRTWHQKCLKNISVNNDANWVCEQCNQLSKSRKHPIKIDNLENILFHILQKMIKLPGSEHFYSPVMPEKVPKYTDYIINPMYLSTMERKIENNEYPSTIAFLQDVQWIKHNCNVYNTGSNETEKNNKLTNIAIKLASIARDEISLLETCQDCYNQSNLLDNIRVTVTEPCRIPHLLVWAKYSKYPYWPAKLLPRRNASGSVDIRFFGESYERAWVPTSNIYLYSKQPPVSLPTNIKRTLDGAVEDATEYIRKLQNKFGQFKFAPPKTLYNPEDSGQIKILLPEYDSSQVNLQSCSGNAIAKRKEENILLENHNKGDIMSTNNKSQMNKSSKEVSEVLQINIVDKYSSHKSADQNKANNIIYTSIIHNSGKSCQTSPTKESEGKNARITFPNIPVNFLPVFCTTR